MIEFTIRPARETDFPSIRRLIHIGGINPTGLDWKRFLVAVTPTGEVVACGQVKPHGKDVLELASIAVHPDHRKQGLAAAVVQRLLAQAPRPLYLMCRSSLGSYYERFGFHSIAVDEMPTFFRRMSQLAGIVTTLAKSGETLWVMKLQ
jgi:N-acetylglutamate synthase-like GNAT family acetyltransferase